MKSKVFAGLSLLLSVSVIVFCYFNFDGQISEPLRYVNQISFYSVLTVPVAVAVIAAVLGVVAYTCLKVIKELDGDQSALK